MQEIGEEWRSDSSPAQAWRMLRSPWSWLRALERLARWKPLLLKVSPLGELSLFIWMIKVVSHLRRAPVSLAIRLRLSLTTRLTSDSSDTAMSSGK